ncbi:hypothetical protein KDL44_00510 [bacterium]|nr:hypothetical protein [bacterium]
MARIKGPDIDKLDTRLQRIFEAQAQQYGQPLTGQHIAAHSPEVFNGMRGMFGALHKSGLLEPALRNLLNRHVALINHCPY